MRILQLTSKMPWPPKDGESVAILALAKGFFLHGHKVTILSMHLDETPFDYDDIPEHMADEIEFMAVHAKPRLPLGRFIRNVLFSRLPFPAERYIRTEYHEALISLLSKRDFDVVQVEGLIMCSYIPVVRKYCNALISYRAHHIEHEIWQREVRLSGFRRSFGLKIPVKKMKRFECSFLNRYDVLVPFTERDGMVFDRLGNRKPRHTSRTGIDLSALVPTAKDLEFPSLFHIGALDWPPSREGLVWFLNYCWPELHARHPALKFYVAGRNVPAAVELRFKNQNVVFLGEVEDAHEFMNSKAVMVVPLHSGSGIRIKIIEGMALGKAIVSTSIGCEGIPAIDHENILVADTPEDFVAAIDEILTDKVLFNRLCKTSVDLIREKFDNMAIVGSLIDFYQANLSRNR